MASVTNELFEKLREKLKDDKTEDAMIISFVLDAVHTLVPRVLDLVKESRRRKHMIGTNLNADATDEGPKRDIEDNSDENDDFNSSTSTVTENAYYDKDKDIIFLGEKKDKLDGPETTHDITFNAKFVEHLKQAFKALAKGNIDDAVENIQMANGLKNTVKIVEVIKPENESETEEVINNKYSPDDNVSFNVESTQFIHEVTVKGDEFDVAKLLRLAEKALTEEKFEKADRFISKANAIFYTNTAQKLTQRVEKAKAEARAAVERSKPKPEQPKAENLKSEDENREENKEYSGCHFEKPADHEAAIKDTDTDTSKFCMQKAQKAFDSKDFKKAEFFLLRAMYFDPNDPKINDMLDDVETILSFKETAVDNHIKNAEDAIQRRYYKEAEKYLTDALLIDPTAEVNDMLTGVRANIEDITKKVRSLEGNYQEARNSERYIEARDYLLKIRETDPSLNVESTLRDINAKIKHRQDMAKSFLHSADLAIEKQNFAEAEIFLLKAQQLKIHIDVDEKLAIVQNQIRQNIEENSGNILRKAQIAKANGELDTALSLYEKAQRMYEEAYQRPPFTITVAIKILRRDIELKKTEQPGPSSTTSTQNPKVYDTEQLDAINQSEWKRCVETALTALEERKYEKANRLLVRAKRIRDTEYIDELIERVRTAELTQPETTEEEASILTMNLIVEKYVQYAIDMKNVGFIYSAESWLKLAPRSTDTCKELMADIEAPLKVLSLKADKEQIAIRKIQARHCIDLAEKCLEADNVEDATTHVIVAQNIFNSLSHAWDIMTKIIKRKFELETGDNSGKFTGKSKHKFKNYIGAEKYNKFMSDCYKEAAGTALRLADTELAKDYLEKANGHYFSIEIKALLIDVCQRAKSADRGTIRGWLKKINDSFYWSVNK